MLFWVELLIILYFSYVVFYSLFFSVVGLFYKTPSFLKLKPSKLNRIAVFIPSYKEDGVIVNVAKQALLQSYPKSSYDVIVIADSLKPETLVSLRKLDIIVHEVHFEVSTKAKALSEVLNTYTGYDVAVILDADNIMQENFLDLMNNCISNGWKAIQGRRMAKNKNSEFAILDGLSENFANHINRQAATVVGLSSTLVGSAMAFDFQLLKSTMNNIDSVVEDKELQIKILDGGTRIYFLREAVVYDEKVDNPDVFKNQRKRWISGHYSYFKKIFVKGIKSLFTGKLSIFNITILWNIQLPRVMNLGLLCIVSVLSILLHQYLQFPFWYWSVLLFLYVLSFALTLPLSYYNRSFFKALLHAPKAFFIVLLLHFKLKGGDKKFIHTPHGQEQ